MKVDDEAALVAALQPFLRWVQAQAERTSLEHSDVFALLRKAEANSPPIAKFLMEGLEVIEEASPADKAEILRAIKVRGKPGRTEGPTEIGIAYDEAVSDIIRRVDAGERQRDVINELAARMKRPELELESIKTQLRDRVRAERERRLNSKFHLRGL